MSVFYMVSSVLMDVSTRRALSAASVIQDLNSVQMVNGATVST